MMTFGDTLPFMSIIMPVVRSRLQRAMFGTLQQAPLLAASMPTPVLTTQMLNCCCCAGHQPGPVHHWPDCSGRLRAVGHHGGHLLPVLTVRRGWLPHLLRRRPCWVSHLL